jgi:hypothetical protein
MKNSYIINKTYEINKLQYYILRMFMLFTTLLYLTVDLYRKLL